MKVNESVTSYFSHIDFSVLDSSIILACSGDEVIRVLDWQQNRVVKTFTGHTDEVSSVVMSPSGQLLLSASADTSVRIWD